MLRRAISWMLTAAVLFALVPVPRQSDATEPGGGFTVKS